MLPIYISYFAGQSPKSGKRSTLKNALGFVLGFTAVFVTLGAFAGTLGRLLQQHQQWFNIIGGIIVILFGLNFTGLLKIPFINANHRLKMNAVNLGFGSSVLFGIIFSVGWTPCVGAFLGSALALAAQSGESLKGVFMLLSFSLGLGIPFIASAVLIGKLTTAFNFIKKHYKVINMVSGCLLILVGILMATGLMGYYLSLLSLG